MRIDNPLFNPISISATSSHATSASYALTSSYSLDTKAPVLISGSAPSEAEIGDLWFDSDNGITYVYYTGSTWVPATANITNATSASYAETATIYSPEFTEVTFDSGIGNAITIDSFIQIYLNSADQFYWRLAPGVANQRTFRRSNYWKLFSSLSNGNIAQSNLIANSTTWNTVWVDASLVMIDVGDTEILKLICVPSSQPSLGIYQADTRVYEIVCTVGSSYLNNKVYWRRVPKEQLLF